MTIMSHLDGGLEGDKGAVALGRGQVQGLPCAQHGSRRALEGAQKLPQHILGTTCKRMRSQRELEHWIATCPGGKNSRRSRAGAGAPMRPAWQPASSQRSAETAAAHPRYHLQTHEISAGIGALDSNLSRRQF